MGPAGLRSSLSGPLRKLLTPSRRALQSKTSPAPSLPTACWPPGRLQSEDVRTQPWDSKHLQNALCPSPGPLGPPTRPRASSPSGLLAFHPPANPDQLPTRLCTLIWATHLLLSLLWGLWPWPLPLGLHAPFLKDGAPVPSPPCYPRVPLPDHDHRGPNLPQVNSHPKTKNKRKKGLLLATVPTKPCPLDQHLHQRLLKGTSHLPGPGNPKPSTEPQQGPHNPAQPVPAAAPTPSWSPQLAPAACHRAQWPPASWGHWHCPPCTPADLAP